MSRLRRPENVALAWTLGACLAVALVFAGSLDNEFVNWDDGIYIANNPLVTAPADQPLADRLLTRGLGYPIPLPVAIYGLLWRLGGSPLPFHLLSLLVHLLNVALFQRLLARELASPRRSAFAALAFALHPIVVEPVAWATGLKDLLVATGILVALLGLRVGPPRALLGLLLALASKPSAGLLGFALPVFRVGRPASGGAGRPTSGIARATTIGSYALAGAAGLAVLALAKTQETPELMTTAAGGTSYLRVLGALGLALEHLVAPASLAPRYPFESVTIAHALAGTALALGAVGLAWWLWRRRDPALGWLALAMLAYLPTSNLVPLIRYTADSYLYLPWLATVAVAAHLASRLGPTWRARAGRSAALLRPAGVIVLLAWAGLSAVQVELWASSRSLWQGAFERYPGDGELVYRYGDALGRAGAGEQELALYLEHPQALVRSPKIPPALVVFHESSGELDEADRWYARGFASDVAQDHGFYWHYVEYVGRHPDRHDARHEVGLAHSLGVHSRSLERSRLDAAQLTALADRCERAGLREPARAYREQARRVSGGAGEQGGEEP